MKKIGFVAITMFVVILLFAGWKPADESSGIQFFQGTWKQALAKAKKEHKPIFLDLSASWCSPCKLLKKVTFTNPEVGDFYNKNFINVEFDGEKGDGDKLSDRFNIYGFPALFYIDENDKVIYRADGYKTPAALIELGKKVLAR
ncbi:MAG: thioredoxin family protein [Bacteroidia bacterium]